MATARNSASKVSSAEAGRRVAISAHDRLAGGERVAEVAVRELAEIDDELLGQRLVEPELGADLAAIACGRRRRGRRNRRPDRRAAARVSMKVTITTPTMLGSAVATAQSFSMTHAAPSTSHLGADLVRRSAVTSFASCR